MLTWLVLKISFTQSQCKCILHLTDHKHLLKSLSKLAVVFRTHVILLVGSAARPKEGTTNLHLDMSDAVNVMVSFVLQGFPLVFSSFRFLGYTEELESSLGPPRQTRPVVVDKYSVDSVD